MEENLKWTYTNEIQQYDIVSFPTFSLGQDVYYLCNDMDASMNLICQEIDLTPCLLDISTTTKNYFYLDRADLPLTETRITIDAYTIARILSRIETTAIVSHVIS
jgi:hypothetical protein